MSTGFGSYPQIFSPAALPKNQVRGIGTAVINAVDNAVNPQFASVCVNNNLPPEVGYALPSGLSNFGPGGATGFTYFYNNQQGVGGSIVTVDLDAKRVLTFTGKTSQTAPTPLYTNVSTRTHVGNLNPPANTAITPINVTSVNSNQGQFPYYVSGQNILTPVQSSENVLGSAYSSGLTNTGTPPLYTQTAATIQSTSGIALPIGSWLFTNWYSENTGTANWGPIITDGTNYYQFLLSSTTGNISLVRNGTILYDVIQSYTASTFYWLTLSLTYLGGTSYRIKCWINGTNYIDFTDNNSSLSRAAVYSGFKANPNDVKHYDNDYYGTTDNALLLEDPTTAAPSISGVTLSYPFVGSPTNFITKVSFTGPVINSWQEGLRIAYTGGYVDIPGNGTGSYSALIELSANSALTAAFVDLTGAVSSTTSLGTTSVPGNTTGATYTTAPNLTVSPSAFSYIENLGNSTYDTTCHIHLDSNGTTTNTSLIGIECLSAPTGTNTYTIVGTIPANSSGDYQPIWGDLSNNSVYDLFIRFIDTNGNKGSVYKVGTTASPPIYVTPLPVPNGVPVAPVVNPSSISITPTVSQTDNVHQAGSLQDFLVSLEVTNVPQDFSVDRLLWAFRRHGTASSGSGNIVKFYAGVVSQGGTLSSVPATASVGLAFDSTGTYTPTDGNMVIFGLSESKTMPAGWTDISGGAGVAWYKIWNGTSDTVNTILSRSHISFEAYEISGSPTVDVSSSVSGSGTSISSGNLTPSVAGDVAVVLFSTNSFGGLYDPSPTIPVFSNGVSYDGYSTLNYSGPGGPDAGTCFSGNVQGLSSGVFSTTITLGSEWASQSWLRLTTILLKVTSSPATFPWTDYAITQLQGLPIPPQTQTNSSTYGQLAVGIAYDLSLQYVSTSNVVGPRTVYESNYLSPIQLTFPGAVQGGNLVVDSSFTKSQWGYNNSGPTGNSNKAGINLNWKFYNIDGINEGFIGRGSDAQGNNYLGVAAASSGITFRAISEPVTVVAGQKIMISGYIDATTCSGGTTGGAYIAVVDNTGTNTFTTTYAQEHCTAGQKGTISLDTAYTVGVGVTQVCFMFHSDEMTISSSNLVFALPMLQQGTVSTAYTPGPPDASDGSTRTPLSVAQTFVANTGTDASTISTSPTTTGSGGAPTSGGSAPNKDQQPQGSLRMAQDGSLWIQTNSVSTSPTWIRIIGTSNCDDANNILVNQVFGSRL